VETAASTHSGAVLAETVTHQAPTPAPVQSSRSGTWVIPSDAPPAGGSIPLGTTASAFAARTCGAPGDGYRNGKGTLPGKFMIKERTG
jgi:hypothetical protein